MKGLPVVNAKFLSRVGGFCGGCLEAFKPVAIYAVVPDSSAVVAESIEEGCGGFSERLGIKVLECILNVLFDCY